MSIPVELLQPAPPLMFQAPLCPLCGGSVEREFSGWKCHACDIEWEGEEPERLDGLWANASIDETEACQSLARRRPSRGRPDDGAWTWQCARPKGHQGEHHASGGATWPNSWLITSEDEAVA